MAQQSKITSRPLTKALGTASILGLAIAGANFANAIQTDFGVEYRADVFNIDGDAYGDDGSGTGLANLLRLKANFKDENTGVSLHTSIQLAGDTWSGDDRESNAGYNGEGNEGVTLDEGYIQVPISGNLLRVGRQASNWNHCFLSCDDRRDRVQMLFPTKVGTFVALYDRRTDEDNVFTSTNDSDAIFLAYITRLAGFNVGLGYNYYIGHTNGASTASFHDAHFISPYISGEIAEGMNFTAGLNYAFGNDRNDGSSPFGDGDMIVGVVGTTPVVAEMDDGLSTFLRLEGDVGAFNWGLQYVGTFDGGLVDPGFDTYSSVLNNNPASTQSPTSLVSMGRGLGMQDYDEHLVIGKLGFNVTPKLNITGAVGWFKADNGVFDEDDTSMIYDLRADYKINDAVSTVASIGVMTDNEAMFALGGSGNGNTLAGVGTPGEFADEDLVAANLGIRVKF